MPVVSIGRKQVNFWISRSGLSDQKKPLLFVHGAGGGQSNWVYQKAFFEREFTPILIDLPGHGGSGEEGETEIGKYAEHIQAFLKTLEVRKTILIGHSMGGAIVQTLALSHPEMIEGLVLVGTGAKLRVLPKILEGIKNDFERTIPEIVRYAFSQNVSAELFKRGIADVLRCRPEVVYGDFFACDRFDIRDRVEKISLPALILCGEEDALTPPKYSEFLHSRIKGSKLEVIPHAGHLVMMESPEIFNERVRSFLVSL
jgi:pimeloyl-ACP methyl ester carboxylesterase